MALKKLYIKKFKYGRKKQYKFYKTIKIPNNSFNLVKKDKKLKSFIRFSTNFISRRVRGGFNLLEWNLFNKFYASSNLKYSKNISTTFHINSYNNYRYNY